MHTYRPLDCCFLRYTVSKNVNTFSPLGSIFFRRIWVAFYCNDIDMIEVILTGNNRSLQLTPFQLYSFVSSSWHYIVLKCFHLSSFSPVARNFKNQQIFKFQLKLECYKVHRFLFIYFWRHNFFDCLLLIRNILLQLSFFFFDKYELKF